MVGLLRSAHPLREAAASRLGWLSEAGGGDADLYEQRGAAPQAAAQRRSACTREQEEQQQQQEAGASFTITHNLGRR